MNFVKEPALKLSNLEPLNLEPFTRSLGQARTADLYIISVAL